MKNLSTPVCYFFLVILVFLVTTTNAQEVGIGTSSPDHKLHIASNTPTLLKIDNTTALNVGVNSEMYLKTGLHYTGAIKNIGTGPFTSRLSFFTYAATSPAALKERLSILDDGSVGIGNTNPAALLDVSGRIRVRHAGGSNTAGIFFYGCCRYK